MGKKYEPLTVDLIEEGRFIENVNRDLRDTIQRLIDHVKEHGVEASKGAKAELTAAITIRFDGLDESDFSIKTLTKKRLPGRPAHATKAVCVYDQGKPDLFVRASGSTDEDPRQQKLATQDGRAIDQESGKAIQPAPPKESH